MSDQPGFWRRALDRLVRSDDEPPSDDAPDAPAGPAPIGRVTARCRVDVRGQVVDTAVVAEPGGPWFEAGLADATGTLTLVWMGRSGVPGIEPGRRLRVTGRAVADRGRLVVFNPAYTLEPA
ncbi:MAG: OB-fold nucleic acid binding domain-containing protein [Propionibacteriaceae bacterium]|nr:OB-fold nucleic acid binding domain-containing protein [Propionibacteriaceae bacterium]